LFNPEHYLNGLINNPISPGKRIECSAAFRSEIANIGFVCTGLGTGAIMRTGIRFERYSK
jgi:hypothetical protein